MTLRARLGGIFSRALGHQPDKLRPFRPPEIFEDDIFLVSYPKSGNTWLRFLIANLMRSSSHEQIDFHNAIRYVPEVGAHSEAVQMAPRPRVLKSHCPYLMLDFPRVIYVVRDPRDVYVSYFYYLHSKLPAGTQMGDFIRNKPFTPGTWSEHVSAWSQHPNSLHVSYEDLLSDTFGCLQSLLRFCGWEGRFSDDWIRMAIDNSTFDSMQTVEASKGLPLRKDGTRSPVKDGLFAGEKRAVGWMNCPTTTFSSLSKRRAQRCDDLVTSWMGPQAKSVD